MSRKRKQAEMSQAQAIEEERLQNLRNLAAYVIMDDDLDDDYILRNHKVKRTHMYWMHPYLRSRKEERMQRSLARLEEDFLRLGCISEFKKTTRMSPEVYKDLLEMVRPYITYQDTSFRDAVTAEERLSLTIRYLTRGDSVTTLHQGYLVGESTVLPIVRDTCKAIFRALHETYLKPPTTRDEWLAIAKGYHDKWNMPHVLGSLDGKHIRIKKPHKSGSNYYNYKGYYSIILFALVDADYKFTYVDVGAEGKAADSTIWKYSSFAQDIDAPGNPLNVPEASTFPGFNGELPYHFLADDAFEMSERLMKPYPSTKLTPQQRIFNYRLSRSRRCVENAFGILATRFRIFRREIEMCPENVDIIVLACVALHNYLRTVAPAAYLPKESCDWEGKDYKQHKGLWRAEKVLAGGKPTSVRNRSDRVKIMRNNLAGWCLTKEGDLPKQWDVVMNHDFYFER